MKIARIETLPIPMGYRDFIACRVFTDEGLTGIGEPYPVGPNDAVAAVIAYRDACAAAPDPLAAAWAARTGGALAWPAATRTQRRACSAWPGA